MKDLYRPWLPPLLLLVAVAALYGHTLQAPFYLDDQWAIIDNHLLRDLPATLGNLFSQRGLTNLTLALNCRLTGLSLPALHLTNIALHAGCGILVWLLLRRLTPGDWPPLCGALLFVAHPVQTQAVTYLIQRATVLGAFFFLLAVLGSLRARQALAAGSSRSAPAYLWPYLGAVAAGACAVLAKENTATLPLLLLAYDRLFPLPGGRSWRQTLYDSLPFCLAPLLLGVAMLAVVANTGGEKILYVPLASTEHNGPLHYLVTQFSVIWVYLRLLLLPYGQALEHNYPVVAELFTLQNLCALAGLLVLGWGTWRIRRRQPLLAFGVVWFFLALAVESSIIPLDPLFEHRLYLPFPGFILVLLAGLPALLGERRALALLGGALLVCAPLTWQRNALWNDPIALYEDNLRHVPGSERGNETLAVLYGKVGRFEEERQLLEETNRLYPENLIVRDNLAKVYAVENRWQEAYALLEEGIKRQPGTAVFYETAAAMASRQGEPQRAVAYLQRGLAAEGADRERLWNDLGVLYSEAGDGQRAVESFRNSFAANPNSPATYLNLGKEYFARGRWPEALAALRRAQELGPGNAETLEGLGRSALQLGDVETARRAAEKLRSADRQAWERLQTEIARTQLSRRQ
jgi:protein O-mannosyl-transferase